MKSIMWWTILLLLVVTTRGRFYTQSTEGWNCPGFDCQIVHMQHPVQQALKVSNRQHEMHGPDQLLEVESGKTYHISGHVRMLGDVPTLTNHTLYMIVEFASSDGYRTSTMADSRYQLSPSDGWVRLHGDFTVPPANNMETRVYVTGLLRTATFLVGQPTVTRSPRDPSWRNETDAVIRKIRMNNIYINVTKAPGMEDSKITLIIKQTRKSFPFGTAVYAKLYNNASQVKYRDFIGKHFNWAVPERYLKWFFIEPVRGQKDYSDALNMIHGLRSQGLKVRGHNLIWPALKFIQKWVQALSGDDLREAVKEHLEDTMNRTRGLVEHWDVINEGLHGTWYRDRLHDPDYGLEVYRMAHSIDPNVKLFLNDFYVVATGSKTQAYLAEATKYKAANVGLYGMGVQCHFPDNQEPNPYLMKERLDLLSQAGVHIWATELDVGVVDENTRAEYYDRALRSLYGHPAVEGILFWGFWDERHLRGEQATLASGDDLTLNAAGRLVFDLLENQWMTHQTHTLSESGDNFTVRGFHGDYELHVMYGMQELRDFQQNFTLQPGQDLHVNVNMQRL